ncbi:MAG: DUF6686 family protein [Bacteroidota bacterium]
MAMLFETSSGSLHASRSRKKLTLQFLNFSLSFTPRSLSKLQAYLSTIDLSIGLDYPYEKRFEIGFSSFPLKLFFNYYEITELVELIEEGLAEYEFQCLLKEAGVSSSSDAMA